MRQETQWTQAEGHEIQMTAPLARDQNDLQTCNSVTCNCVTCVATHKLHITYPAVDGHSQSIISCLMKSTVHSEKGAPISSTSTPPLQSRTVPN